MSNNPEGSAKKIMALVAIGIMAIILAAFGWYRYQVYDLAEQDRYVFLYLKSLDEHSVELDRQFRERDRLQSDGKTGAKKGVDGDLVFKDGPARKKVIRIESEILSRWGIEPAGLVWKYNQRYPWKKVRP